MSRIRATWAACCAVVCVSLPLTGPSAQEDADAMAPSFKEGDVITFDKIESLKPFLPEEFWANRDFFFYEGMQLEIGPFYRDYSASDAFKAATEKFRGQARIGPDGSLEGHTAGRFLASE